MRHVWAAAPLFAAVTYLGVFATALAWYCWYKGVAFAETGTVAVFFFAQSVVGAVLGTTLLGKRLGAEFLIGCVCMAAGISLVSTDETATVELALSPRSLLDGAACVGRDCRAAPVAPWTVTTVWIYESI